MPHATKVDGYDGSLQSLAQKILRMRYDKVEEFFSYCVSELDRQAEGDRKRKRRKLARMLGGASETAAILEGKMGAIFELCAPYMKDELK